MATRNGTHRLGWRDPIYWVILIALSTTVRHFVERFVPDLPWYYMWAIRLPIFLIILMWVLDRIERRAD